MRWASAFRHHPEVPAHIGPKRIAGDLHQPDLAHLVQTQSACEKKQPPLDRDGKSPVRGE